MFEAPHGCVWYLGMNFDRQNADDDVDDDGDGDDVILGSKNNAIFGTRHGL